MFKFKVMSFFLKIVQATLCTVSQLLRPGLPYMPNASRTKEKQTLATPRYGSAVIFNTSSLTRRAGSNLLLLQVTLNDGGLDKNQSKLKRKKYIYIYKFKTLKKKQRLGSAALTRNEAKSMSTRLLAGESFAIFQIKAELSFAFVKSVR